MTTNYCDNNLPFFPRQLFISVAIVPYSQTQENKTKQLSILMEFIGEYEKSNM